MPIVLQEMFDVEEEDYSDFIHRYHRDIIDLINQFHDGLGVVGPSKLTNDTRWSTVELTNNIGRRIQIATSLESLWIYGYRRSSDGDNISPWKLFSESRHDNFSSLPGQHESLGFEGNYTTSISTQNVSRPALNNAITVLDNYSHRPANSDKARNAFLVIVLYFAEALRILPIRDLLCNNFAQHKPVEVGVPKMNLAQNWHVISSAFLNGSYSRLAREYQIQDANDLKENLWLVFNKRTKLHDLDGVRDNRPGDPGNEDETGPRDSGMGGYSGDGGPKRSGGQGGSKNEGSQLRDRVASSRSRRPRVLRDSSLPICVPEMVHDWELGDPAEDSNPPSSLNNSQSQPPPSGTSARNTRSRPDPADLRAMSSVFGSRGMSFAAAAMAGLACVSGRGIHGSSRDRRGLGLGGSSSEHNNSLTFTAGGRQLSKNLTIYQAIQQQLVHDEEDDERFGGSDLPNDGSRFQSDIFTITYQKADGSAAQGGSGSASSAMKSKSGSSRTGTDGRGQQVSLLDSLLLGKLPCDMEKSDPTYNILALLRVLEGLNQLAPCLRVQVVCDDFAEGRICTLDELYNTGGRVPHEDFVNNKLTPKLSRQIQDVLALCSGSLPSWCYQLTKSCPFLFPFETRRQYFYSTAFGLSRALHHLQQQQSADNTNSSSVREVQVNQLQRQKVCVSRNRILDSAAKVMEMFSSQKAVLEVEYFGEVGTGLGPTLEFYTLLSHDLQKASLGLWQSSSNFEDSSVMKTDLGSDGKKPGVDLTGRSNDLVRAPLGLFPCPWSVNADMSEGSQFYKVMEYFRLTGRVMAKALQDGRLLDLPLSTAFYKLVLGQELDLHDILSFDTELGKILQELQILVHHKKYLESSGDSTQAIDDLRFRGAPIEDLCLDFTLPGYPGYMLKEGEESTSVNIDNLEECISLVVDATVKMGIARQMEAFRTRFNQVFDVSSLQIFSPNELDYLICGHRELWEAETLVDHIKFDNGYTAKSPVIVNLLEIMAEFSPEQQHAFCQFVTGAPRLPPGGLAALSPKLTIVRKHPSNVTSTPIRTGATESADEDLPSVMTCANYLKLPPYSTKEVMYKKLLYAINEGQGSFDLS